MNIVALAPETSPGAAYRSFLPMRALAQRGHRTAFFKWDDLDGVPPPVDALRQADVVHMWRYFRTPAHRLMSALREAGVAVVFDTDDDITRVPKGSPAYRGPASRDSQSKGMSTAMRLAHLVTTTGGDLAGRLRKLGGDVRVVENYVERESLRAPTRSSRTEVTVGWVAAQEHREDFKKLGLRRSFQQLIESQPQVRLVSLGLDLGLRHERYTHVRGVAFTQLTDAIARFDIGIAPLANTAFNRARSNVKLKEYAAAGVPWLASAIGPYKDLGDVHGGRLVADHRWTEELVSLVTDTEEQDRLRQQATAWARTQTIGHNVDRWEAVFAEAVARAGAATSNARPQAGGPR